MSRFNIRRRLHTALARLQRWLAKDQFDDLREFVYLDEISVRSLLASTGEGGIVSETVDEEMRRRRSGSRAGGSLSIGPVSANSRVDTERERQNTTVETRNYDLIQSKFTRLYMSDVVEKKLSLHQIPIDGPVDEPFTGLPTSKLQRGDIIELRVNLSANLLFRLYQTIDYFADIFDDHIDSETEEILELIDSSFGNRIPVIGKAVDYKVVEGDDKILKKSDHVGDEEHAEDLEVVTLLNLDSLWVDPIQTLFDNERFVIYCRIEDVDVDRWYPLKVTRAINSLSPPTAQELNQQFRQGLEEARSQLSEMQNFSDWSTESAAQWGQEIQLYIEILEEEFSYYLSDGDKEQLLNETMENVELGDEVSQTARRKKILNECTDTFIGMSDVGPIDEETRQELRLKATRTAQSRSVVNYGNDESGFRIEAKTVAIYW